MTKSRGKIESGDNWEEFKVRKDAFKIFDNRQQLETLCAIGHLAPSTHNTQPWRFFLNPETFSLVIYLDRRFVLPVSDISGRQGVVSCGCSLKNILIAAAFYDLAAKIEYSPTKSKQVLPFKTGQPRYVKLARVFFKHLSESKPVDEILFQSIFSRKIMRTEFDPGSLVPEALQKKLAHLCDGEKLELLSVTKPLRRTALAEFQGQADGYVINTQKFARELGQWLLPNNTDNKLGMPGIGFGLKDDQAERLHAGLLGTRPLEPEDGLRFALGGKLAIEKSPYIGLISVFKDIPEYWLKAGLALQEMLLTLESQGFSCAIHAAIVEVALVNRMFAASLGSRHKLAALFRAGKVKDPSHLNRPHAPRQELSAIFLDAEA